MKHSYEIKTVYVGHRVYKIGNGFSIRVNITIKEYTFADGTPFGIKEE